MKKFLLGALLFPFSILTMAQVAPVVTSESFGIDEFAVLGGGSTTNGSVVGTVTASDGDGDVLTYAITTGNTDSAFGIDSGTGEITVLDETVLDYETIQTFILTIEVTDDELTPRTGTGTITINLNDISPNDFCTSAIDISVGETLAGSTRDATNDSSIAPDCGSNPVEADISVGVWYHLVGTGDKITLSTCDDADYDTSIGVYSGSCTTGLNCIAGNDDGDGCSAFSSRTSFISNLDEDYFILIDGYEDSFGDFNLTVTSSPAPIPPSNDDCSDAEPLTVFAEGTGTVTNGDNTNATNYTSVVYCDEYGTINDVWYSFNSGPNTEVSIDIQLVDTDGAGLGIEAGFINWELYENCNEAGLDYCGSDGTSLFEVTPNTDYKLQLWNSENDEGTFTILLNDGPNTIQTVNDASVDLSRYATQNTVVTTVTAAAPDAEGHEQSFELTAGNSEGIFSIDASTGEILVADEATLSASATTSFPLTIQMNDLGPGTLNTTATITINIIDNAYPTIDSETVSIDENTANATSVLTVTVSDADGDNLSFDIISGNTNSAFAIDGAGTITVNDVNALDFETTPTFMLEVEATDDGPLTLSSTSIITINLNDINEAPVILTGGSVNISKNSPNGYSIGYFEFTDEDDGQSHSYSITAGNTNTIFAIGAATGEFTVINATDLLANGVTSYVVTVELTDDGTPPESGTTDLTINVFDNNEPIIDAATFDVDENSSNGTSIGTITATDPEGDNVTFSIYSGNNSGAFALSPAGLLTVSDPLLFDYESTSTYELIIEAQDDGAGNLMGYEIITVNVNNVNETPVLTSSSFDISYNSPNGYSIGFPTVSDPENDALSYSITAGNSSSIFGINSVTGEITIADGSLLNPATMPTHELTVMASDADFSPTTTVTINVYGNDYPVITTTSFDVDENSAQSTLVGTIESDDADGIMLFEITDGNSGNLFSIDATTGDLTINNNLPFDYESAQQFDISIRLTDNGLGNLQKTETVSISLNDVNEFDPEVTTSSDNNIDENAANGTTAGTITASDGDVFQTLSYAIVSGNTSSAFTIDGSGTIVIADNSVLDFETTPSYSLGIEVSDDVSPIRTTSTSIIINLNDANDVPVIEDQSFSIDENSSNATTVGTVTATDQDSGQTLSYSITAGNTGNAFIIDNSGNISVNDAAQLDFETSSSFSLTVEVTDDGTGALSASATVTININDVNEAPTIADQAFNIDENSANTTSIGIVTATDQDSGQTLSYSITSGNTGSAFAIDNSGSVTVNDASQLDFETSSSFGLTVEVTDDGLGALSASATITVNVNDVNEAPTVDISIPDQSATQLAPFSFMVDANTFGDVDSGDSFTYSAKLLDSSGLPDWLTFDESTLTFSGTPTLSDNSITVLLTATDIANNSISDDFNIDITVVSGIEQTSFTNLNAYPNPVINEVILDVEGTYDSSSAKVKVIDSNGILVINRNEEMINNKLRIDVEELKAGIYILQIESSNQYYISKIIKK